MSYDRITVTQEDAESPTVIPHRILLGFLNGKEVFRDEADEATKKTASYEEYGDPIPLRTISQALVQFLHLGTIELVAGGGTYFERLLIRAGGYVELHTRNSDWTDTSKKEIYDPLTAQHPNLRQYLYGNDD